MTDVRTFGVFKYAWTCRGSKSSPTIPTSGELALMDRPTFPLISAEAILRSRTGRSLARPDEPITAENLEASNYASGFASPIYPGRNVPDVCGLVGMMPRARYIMLPVQPNGNAYATGSGGQHPDSDETAPGDWWAVFSGTSAAAPQLAGVCALMKQASPGLWPLQARDVLKRTTRDVVLGRCSARQAPTRRVPAQTWPRGTAWRTPVRR